MLGIFFAQALDHMRRYFAAFLFEAARLALFASMRAYHRGLLNKHLLYDAMQVCSQPLRPLNRLWRAAETAQEEPTMTLVQDFLYLAAAVILGAAIGFERQWRQRLAGLRTNTLVALGAASFVMFSGLVPGDSSPTRVAAQVVSGIGFLGAGLIFKEGLSVHGLNTAATLWCSAAVGVLAGARLAAHAALVAVLVVFVNLCLRPLARFIQSQPLQSTELVNRYLIAVVCRSEGEAHIRALLLQSMSAGPLRFQELNSRDIESTDRVEVCASVTADQRKDNAFEQIVGRLRLEPHVTAARWRHETAAA
jgi:putative Mg2+ transporter-C (MgtC) family protein